MPADIAPSRDSLRERGLLAVVLLVVLLSMSGWGLVAPLLPFYAIAFHANPWQVTLMFAAYSMGQLGGELFWGQLSDRIGRRTVLLITIFASAAAYAAFANAPNIWVAIAVRLAAGVFGGNLSSLQSQLVSTAPPERVAGRIGLMAMCTSLGVVIGPAVGGLFARPQDGVAGFHAPLLAAGALYALAGLALMLLLRAGPQARPVRRDPAAPGLMATIKASLADPTLRRLFTLTFLSFSAFSVMASTLGLWSLARFGWGPRQIGLILACNGVVSAIYQGLLVGRLSRRFGDPAVLRTLLMTSGSLLFVTPFLPGPWIVAPPLMLALLTIGMPAPSVAAMVSRAAPPDRQGACLGANASAGALARILGPLAAGAVFTGVGHFAPFLLAGLTSVIGLTLVGWPGRGEAKP
jgi:DHA1 family tetracycline resistance protein-like MFS transporter